MLLVLKLRQITKMLLLLFEIGDGRYALDVNQIIEIVPLVKFKKIPTTPDYVAGLMNYRGDGAPVIDLCQLIDHETFDDALSTRIINSPTKGIVPGISVATVVAQYDF